MRSPGAKPLRGRLLDAAERLVAEHETVIAGRRRAVFAGDDLSVGAAYSNRDRVDEQVAQPGFGLRHVRPSAETPGCSNHGQSAHATNIKGSDPLM